MRQNISFSSLAVGKTQLLDGWNSLATRPCGQLGYTATCPKPWSLKAANCGTFAWSLAPLLIFRSNLNWQIDVDLMQQLRKKLVYLKLHDFVQRLRVSRHGLKTFLCLFWNPSGVLHDRLLKMSLMVTPYVNELSQIANKYCSHFDKTLKNCGALRLQDNARKHTANQRKTTFLHWIFMLVATQRIAPAWHQPTGIHFVFYSTF